MQIKLPCHSNQTNSFVQIVSFVISCVCISVLGYTIQSHMIVPSAVLGVLIGGILTWGLAGKYLSKIDILQNAFITGALAASADPTMMAWQPPKTWIGVLALSSPSAAVAGIFYCLLVAYSVISSGRHLRLGSALFALGALYWFNAIFILQSAQLLDQLGRFVVEPISVLYVFSPYALSVIGRAVVLVAMNELVVFGLCLLLARRTCLDMRVHLLLVGSGIFAALTPVFADLGSSTALASLPHGPKEVLAMFAAAFAQAGLWGETFLITGILMDALHAKHPIWNWCSGHFKNGAGQGATYSVLFMGVVYVIATSLRSGHLMVLFSIYPFISATIGGIVVFPLIKTVVESFEGCLPFFMRLRNNYSRWDHCLRGGVVGLSIALAIVDNAIVDKILTSSQSYRFIFGFVAGAIAFAGVSIVRDIVEMTLLKKRSTFQYPRMYLTDTLLGGFTGGALAWYFDVSQAAVIVDKFQKYAAFSFADSGIKVENYVIYPLFSKWGEMNLGAATGGIRLFYGESLSGVINWSISAPLFSINLVILTALFTRNWAPIKNLFTEKGIIDIVEQAFRVQRWGLWMAPIIYSFLRQSPIPTWYNQDGAIRTTVATVNSLTMTQAGFKAWSLETFKNMLAYDWLRISISLDHMGLRVATLVNFSFVGLDVLDEKLARFWGHAARARAIPSGIRRFMTWAPLLIPFYLPREGDWSYAWDQSQEIIKANNLEVFPIGLISVAFLFLSLTIGSVLLLRHIKKQKASLPFATSSNGEGIDDSRIVLQNGTYTLSLFADGRGWSNVLSAIRHRNELDLTARPHDALHLRGKFCYITDKSLPNNDPNRTWSLTYQPMRKIGLDYAIKQVDWISLQITNTFGGIASKATVKVDGAEMVETWELSLTNTEDRPRNIDMTTYREFALNHFQAYMRHPDYNGIHVGTWFVKDLNAIIAQNRILKTDAKCSSKRKISPEVAFHAVGFKDVLPDGCSIKLYGYEDSRPHFIGHGTLRSPEHLMDGARDTSDEGLLYTFDPIGSLKLNIELAPHATVTFTVVDGYAASADQAAIMICKFAGLPENNLLANHSSTNKTQIKNHSLAPLPHTLNQILSKRRKLHGFGAPSDKKEHVKVGNINSNENCYSFSRDGTELNLGWDTPRPWSHVIANELGYGVVVNNKGDMFSFNGNSQQNGITPFAMAFIPAVVPGQAIYLYNKETKEIDTPTFAPFNKTELSHDVLFGRGYAQYRKSLGDLEAELTVFVLPDEPAEVRLLCLTNTSDRPVSYRVVPYCQIVLAEVPADTKGIIVAEHDDISDALLFSNPRNDFQRGYAFVATSLPKEKWETSRARFIGNPEHDLTNPYFVEYGESDMSRSDDGYKAACFAGTVNLAPGERFTMSIVIGQTSDKDHARKLIRSYTDIHTAELAFKKSVKRWVDICSALRVETNNEAFDRMVNDWLPYQVIASHLWGRLGPNQRSGGFGFRDQLQDALPLLYTHPKMARSQILLNAAQQFFPGDCMQWWHQSWNGRTGLGTRNRASDPHLWLPYLVYKYVNATDDTSILDENLPFLEGRRIPRNKEGVMFAPRVARDVASLYEHCLKAIDFTLSRLGAHGLPLIGTGDWNDGLSLVGFKGKGESVWLGCFLYDILIHFAPIIEARDGLAKMQYYLGRAEKVREGIDLMWRETRYVRATTDSGMELVFADALTASWPAISGVASYERAARALDDGLRSLETDKLIQLCSPPFTEESQPYPGKIADYPPGVRENGGQYSHGTSWLVDALMCLSDMAQEEGQIDSANEFRARAREVWLKISPLDHITPDAIMRYGLPPHQQPADVYYGYGYEGRGGWSWYTGAAARLLYVAYQMLGIKLDGGELKIHPDAFKQCGPLELKKVCYKGKVLSES